MQSRCCWVAESLLRIGDAQRPLPSSSATCPLLLVLGLQGPHCKIGVMLLRSLGNSVQGGVIQKNWVGWVQGVVGGVIQKYWIGGVQGTWIGGVQRDLGVGVLGTWVGKNVWCLGGGMQRACCGGLQRILGHGVVRDDGAQRALADGVPGVAGGGQRGVSYHQGQSMYSQGETPAEASLVTVVVLAADAVALLLAALVRAAGLTLAWSYTALGATEQFGGHQQL